MLGVTTISDEVCSQIEKAAQEYLKTWDKTPRMRRRALTLSEVHALLNKCRPRFRLLYETAIVSGLRRGELRSLKVADLNVDMGGLNLDAAWTKNRKQGFQPLPPDLVARLAESAKGKAPADRLLICPASTSRRFNEDLARAGIMKDGPGGRADFHDLRVTYDNLILDGGASPKEAMDLMRHSTLDLTLNVYGRSRWERRSEIVQGIGQAVLSGLENGPDTITGPERKVAGLEYPGRSEASMVGTRGLEPRTPTVSR